MPSTVVELLVILLAILPGLPGEEVYRRLVGVDWREREWRSIVRVLLFSALGIALYGAVAIPLGAPNPYVLSPDLPEVTPERTSFRFTVVPEFFLMAYAGHFMFSAIAGLVLASTRRILGHWTPTSPYPAAWDEFTRSCLPERWTVITLRNGQTYAGIVETADASVAQSERDIVLREPALLEDEVYRSVAYQYMFLPAELIASVAAVYNPKTDRNKRLVEPGDPVFAQEETTPNG